MSKIVFESKDFLVAADFAEPGHEPVLLFSIDPEKMDMQVFTEDEVRKLIVALAAWVAVDCYDVRHPQHGR